MNLEVRSSRTVLKLGPYLNLAPEDAFGYQMRASPQSRLPCSVSMYAQSQRFSSSPHKSRAASVSTPRACSKSR